MFLVCHFFHGSKFLVLGFVLGVTEVYRSQSSELVLLYAQLLTWRFPCATSLWSKICMAPFCPLVLMFRLPHEPQFSAGVLSHHFFESEMLVPTEVVKPSDKKKVIPVPSYASVTFI